MAGVAESTGSSWVYRLAWLFYLALALAATAWLGVRQGRIELSLFVNRLSWWKDLGIGVGIGMALVAAWRLAAQAFPAARTLETELAELLGPLKTSEIVALAALSGFSEELFFRGAVQGAWGWIPATLLFALLHTGPGWSYKMWTAFAALAGLVLAGLMIWRGNLLAPAAAHMVVNGVNLGRLSRIPGGPESGRSAPE
jgi:membrane protease YdiL (CAAX protease family)